MKKYGAMLFALLVCGALYAAQNTALEQVEVRDPRRLETWLEGNASDAQSRLAACEAGTITLASGNILVGNTGGTGTAVSVSGDISLSTAGSVAVTQLNAVAVATVTAGAAAGATAMQPITQTCTVATNASLVFTPTITSSAAGTQMLCGWVSETAGGVGVGTNITSIVGASSTTVFAGGGDGAAYAVWSSHTTGVSVLTITSKAAQTLYFNVLQNNGVVKSTPAVITAP